MAMLAGVGGCWLRPSRDAFSPSTGLCPSWGRRRLPILLRADAGVAQAPRRARAVLAQARPVPWRRVRAVLSQARPVPWRARAVLSQARPVLLLVVDGEGEMRRRTTTLSRSAG